MASIEVPDDRVDLVEVIVGMDQRQLGLTKMAMWLIVSPDNDLHTLASGALNGMLALKMAERGVVIGSASAAKRARREAAKKKSKS